LRGNERSVPSDIRLKNIGAFLLEQDAVAVARVLVLAGCKHDEMPHLRTHFSVAFVVIGRQAFFQPLDAVRNFAVDAPRELDGVGNLVKQLHFFNVGRWHNTP
jgi:hypothetical protein